MRRGAERAVGATIAAVERCPCRRKPIAVRPGFAQLARRSRGRRIDAAERAGKRVVLRLDGGDALVFEPRMTGLVLLADSPDDAYLRLRLRLSGGRVEQLLYWDRRGLGHVKLLTPREFELELGPVRLGPDALGLSAEQYRERLGASRRAVKTALLDQRAVAGIGNLYAAEILHVAAIHPERRCSAMTGRQWQALADAADGVLREAIRYEGSTLSDGTYRNALNAAGGYQNRHRVYDKAGQACPRCGAAIRRIVQAQRATFFCGGCQRRSG